MISLTHKVSMHLFKPSLPFILVFFSHAYLFHYITLYMLYTSSIRYLYPLFFLLLLCKCRCLFITSRSYDGRRAATGLLFDFVPRKQSSIYKFAMIAKILIALFKRVLFCCYFVRRCRCVIRRVQCNPEDHRKFARKSFFLLHRIRISS